MTDQFSEKCQIDKNDTTGRFVKAVQMIKAGEIILVEKPIIIVFLTGDKRCSNCFKYALQYCSKCQISPLCLDCQQHNAFDCATISSMSSDTVHLEVLKKNPECYGILKCLLLHENPETQHHFESLIKLDSHIEKRRNTTIWQEYNQKIIQPLMQSNILKFLKVADRITEDFLQHICGAFDVNMFEIRAPDTASLRGLYLNGSLTNHQCTPNVNVAIDDQFRLKMYANRNIGIGEMLTNCYTNVLLSTKFIKECIDRLCLSTNTESQLFPTTSSYNNSRRCSTSKFFNLVLSGNAASFIEGTEERRHILLEGKYFHCTCPRCEDPTELGSHMSSLICAPCAANNRDGYIIRNPTKKAWQCFNCSHTLRNEQVENILERVKEEVFHAQDDVRRYEILLAKLTKILHQNHYIMVDIKQNIASILRSIIMTSLQRPGRRVYERKVRLCQELVVVLHLILPGISRLKGIALYELANASAELYRLKFGEKELTQQELQDYLRKCEAMLKEAVRMLLYEPQETPEGQLSKSIMSEIKDLRNDIQLLDSPLEESVTISE